ncbi:MAG: HPr family phosphocarrier protein [Defluviitaleaceae bacterium]|nr:HPr family phosphocarrier protein [Defluviitaleaceae bacterium]MCL2240228.1 HPr family phosphocarrier protein [Defluviitaleaceae bacterium]
MVEKNVTITNKLGLHARPASDFVRFAKSFGEKITLVKGDKTANAKSILQVLSLSLTQGSTCTVKVEGDSPEAVAEKIVEFINGLDE